jgi:hypothetical protein
MIRFWLWPLAAVTAWLLFSPAPCVPEDPANSEEIVRFKAFQPGERLNFDLHWNGIFAGTAVLTVEPLAEIGGQPAWHFLLSVRSSPFLDVFYKVRSTFEGFADLSLSRSLLYRKKQQEGSYRSDVRVDFDWEAGCARYENRGKKRAETPILPGTFDPLSVCYFLRLQDLVVGQELEAPVSDGKKCVPGRIRVVAREFVNSPAGRFDTFVLEPDLRHLEGVFKRSKAATLRVWITADEKRIPVKVKSQVKVGHFTATLVPEG